MPATSKACAPCRHQKKRCNGSCEVADLFPASRYDEFQNAQRHFGVSNMHGIIRAVDPEMRKQAAKSILMEGNIRRRDPVHGCLGVARRLRWEIRSCEKQLEDANRRLSLLRQRDWELKRL
ncbi:LOB domain-containing protein 27-like [Eucalyptus grandis]|uniref:LOB domain-containing protein 27-like n=1 Tax=Eucalyptus grandis TaxID=71139 RepID=UPI00192EA3AC|nr:LOB domain-containing protein 27-like [Eucalyptus grandis]